MFHLYGRSLHPELFEIHSSREVERGGYTARVEITSAGHLITWRYEGVTLTEVVAAREHPLPQRRRLMAYRLSGNREDGVKCRGGVRYRTSFTLEPINPELFWMFQNELTRDGERKGLLHRFDKDSRLAIGALGYINVETRSRSMLVQAFHTFPEEFALVKSETVFELP